jgi:hypothetical protein
MLDAANHSEGHQCPGNCTRAGTTCQRRWLTAGHSIESITIARVAASAARPADAPGRARTRPPAGRRNPAQWARPRDRGLPVRSCARRFTTSNSRSKTSQRTRRPAGDPPGWRYRRTRRTAARLGGRGRLAVHRDDKERTLPHFQRITHPGTCGKTRVVPHNRWSGLEPTEWESRNARAVVDVRFAQGRRTAVGTPGARRDQPGKAASARVNHPRRPEPATATGSTSGGASLAMATRFVTPVRAQWLQATSDRS